MTTPQELRTLAERVERATGPDREIDIAVGLAALGWRWLEDGFNYSERWQILDFGAANAVGWYVDGAVPDCVPSPTASFDVSMTLLPEGYWHGYYTGDEGFTAHCFEQVVNAPLHEGNGATPALAMLASCLRAHAANLERDNG